MCLLTLTLKFSTRTPKVPFGPLGGASGIALFTARAPGGPRAPFFFSRGGSGAAPGGLGGASGAPLGRPGASRATCRRPRGRSGSLLGHLGDALGLRWASRGAVGEVSGTSRAPWDLLGGCEAGGVYYPGPDFVVVSLHERAGYLGLGEHSILWGRGGSKHRA